MVWLNFLKHTKFNSLTSSCWFVVTRACMPAYGFFAGAFKFCKYVFCEGTAISEVLSSGWKAATNPLYNSMQKKADKIEWGGEELVSNVSLSICDWIRNSMPRGHAELRLRTFCIIFLTLFLRSLLFPVPVLSLGMSEEIKVTMILHLLGIWINIRAVSSAVWEHNASV